MICPECGCEYRDGFTKCTDCGCNLKKSSKSLHKVNRQNDHRGWIKAFFLVSPIILTVVLLGIYDSLNSLLQYIASLSIPCIFFIGSVLSLHLRLPIYGFRILTLMKVEKEEYSIYDQLTSIILIILSTVILLKLIFR